MCAFERSEKGMKFNMKKGFDGEKLAIIITIIIILAVIFYVAFNIFTNNNIYFR